jgi:hypothetical protein
MMATRQEHLEGLLAIYRRAARHLENQVKMHGNADVPPITIASLRDTITKIIEIKVELRSSGIPVDSAPEDLFDFRPFGG